ncbi:hypothetical protein [Caulobacter segnis]
MTSFTLTDSGVTYTLTLNGDVSTPTGAFGTWTTDGKSTNQIVLTKTDGTTKAIAVAWSFNADNQLCVTQGAGAAFNFTVSAVRPDLKLDSNNKLHVRPPSGGTLFEFTLVCGFALLADGNLEVAINGQKSKLTGTPTSNKAYFGYTFRDKAAPSPAVLLAFWGEWVRDTSKPDQIELFFQFKVDATAYKFTMPTGASATISPQNQLLITGIKKGQAWGVTIQGALSVRKDDSDFSLVFTLDQQHTASGVKTTTIAIKAVFAPDDNSRLNAALDLYIGVTKTPTSKRVTVKGEGELALGATSLDITFAYSNIQTTGHEPVVALMIGTEFAWKNGTLAVSYEKEGGRTTVNLSTKFLLKDEVQVDGRLNVTKDGKEVGVYGALGISW